MNTKYLAQIKKQLEEHPNIICIGERENPFKYLKKADYSVLTSDMETWGLVLTESKIVGTPCVVTNFDVAFEQVNDGENGFIIDMTDENYSEIIEKMISMKTILKNNLNDFEYDIESIIKKWNYIL